MPPPSGRVLLVTTSTRDFWQGSAPEPAAVVATASLTGGQASVTNLGGRSRGRSRSCSGSWWSSTPSSLPAGPVGWPAPNPERWLVSGRRVAGDVRTGRRPLDDRHAPRRTPAVPDVPLSLDEAGQELLATARGQRSGRAARALLPGAGATLTETLVALTADSVLDDHVANGPATLYVLSGDVELRWGGDQTLRVAGGQWAPITEEKHSVHAAVDSICLVTVAPSSTGRA